MMRRDLWAAIGRLTLDVEEMTLEKTIGILLWGPPGSGKSATANALISQHSPMFFINTDEIVERVITYMPININSVDKQKLYWSQRNRRFREQKHKLPILLTLFHDVFGSMEPPTPAEITEFIARHNNDENILSLFTTMIIYFAKKRGHGFMIETTGENFSKPWAEQTFAHTKSILEVVYVSSADELVARVTKRTNQLVNAPPDRVRQVYAKSYFATFHKAIRANVFDEINVTSNDASSPRPLIRLTRHQHQYILDFHNPTTLNPNEETFLRDMLAELPPTLFGRTALFCTRTCAWTAFL